MKLLEQLSKVGFVGERKALALLCLGFYSTVFTVMGLIATSQIPEWAACFFGLAGLYGIAFFAAGADWFWGRWFAIGIGSSGVSMAVLSMLMTKEVLPTMVVFGVMHGLVWACLLGDRMAVVYDARDDWRKRWNLDEHGVIRIKNSVTRAAASLPTLIMWALAPREEADRLALACVALGAVGLLGLLRARTWGVLALGVAGAGAMFDALLGASRLDLFTVPGSPGIASVPVAAFGLAGGAMALFAVLPFAAPVVRYLRRARA